MAKWIRFDGTGTLTISDDLVLGRGSCGQVDDETAQKLLDSPDIYGPVTVITAPKADKPAASDSTKKE